MRNRRKLFLLAAIAALHLAAGSAHAAERGRQGEDILLDSFHRHQALLEKSSFGFPLHIESSDRDGRLHVDVYGIFDHAFSSILDVLKVPANWCDIASLHPNVKACTYRELPGEWLLTFYVGRKANQTLEETYHFLSHYRSVAQREGYLDIVLSASDGPFGTKDHGMRFEALSIDKGRTLVHVSYGYNPGLPVRFAGAIYFATFGHGKAGFTVTGTDGNGNPLYIGGQRGAIERNAVRYYLAIKSFMDTLHYSDEIRFNMRVSTWYDHTNHFKRQLFDMEKKDYIAIKTEERKQQMILQHRLSKGPQPVLGPAGSSH